MKKAVDVKRWACVYGCASSPPTLTYYGPKPSTVSVRDVVEIAVFFLTARVLSSGTMDGRGQTKGRSPEASQHWEGASREDHL
jgi:hypothetical protein